LSAPPIEPPRPADNAPSFAPRSAAEMSEEEKAHNDARRFARLLVSEIKLYNEQKVAEGRRNNDLYDRLKEDIDRSRQMYEKRVTSSVAAKFDYFYDELVNTLAEGDAARLGSDYPGPSVAV
jgi:molecular chaperone GrpE (heat shock protein)